MDKAEKMSFGDLKEECRRVKASVITDEEDRHRRIHKARYLRAWMERDGAVRLSARLTPDEGALLLAAVDARRDEIIVDAFRGRWYENPEAHRADALVDVALTAGGHGAGSGSPPAMVHVLVDYEALVRGSTITSEKCEVSPGPPPGSPASATWRGLCRWHHYQKSHLGYTYRGGPGTWEWVAPQQPVGPPAFPP